MLFSNLFITVLGYDFVVAGGWRATALAGGIFQRANAALRNHSFWLIVFLKVGNLVQGIREQ